MYGLLLPASITVVVCSVPQSPSHSIRLGPDNIQHKFAGELGQSWGQAVYLRVPGGAVVLHVAEDTSLELSFFQLVEHLFFSLLVDELFGARRLLWLLIVVGEGFFLFFKAL